MTTKYNEVNVRNGPGLNHLVIYKILIKGYPLKIISNTALLIVPHENKK